jgi:DNA-directed RNA polymerase subunit beta
MGSNMQRQAVSLLKSERPFVGTGLEAHVTRDIGSTIIAKHNCYISYVDANVLIILLQVQKILI